MFVNVEHVGTSRVARVMPMFSHTGQRVGCIETVNFFIIGVWAQARVALSLGEA